MLRAALLATALLAAPLGARADVPSTAANGASGMGSGAAAQPAAAPPAVQPPAAQAPAAQPPASPQQDPSLYGDAPEVESGGYLLFKTLVVLAMVVALIYLTLNFGVRKLFRLGPQATSLVKVVDRVAVEPKKSLLVLQVGAEYLLVSSSEQGMSLLSKLDAENVQKALAERIAAQPAMPSFLERLNALGKPAPRKPQ